MKTMRVLVAVLLVVMFSSLSSAQAVSANFSYRIQGWKDYISQWLDSDTVLTSWEPIAIPDEKSAYYSLFVYNKSYTYDFALIFQYDSDTDSVGSIIMLCNPSQDLWADKSYRNTLADILSFWIIQTDSGMSEDKFKIQYDSFSKLLSEYFAGDISSEYATSGDIGSLRLAYIPSKGDSLDSIGLNFVYAK